MPDGFVVKTEYKRNRPGIAMVAMGDEIKAATKFIAYQAMAHAVSISPRSRRLGYYRHSEREHPHYQDSFQVDQYVEEEHGYPHPWPRWAARVANVSVQAIVVEIGSSRNPAYRVLRKTLEFLDSTADK